MAATLPAALRLSVILWVCAFPAIVAEASCEDREDSCEDWAEAGECTKNSEFMRKSCALSCEVCKGTDQQEEDVVDERLGPERVHLQTSFGEITIGFFPSVAPVTSAHILWLFQHGCYDTNHIFRVDKGFVAQLQAVIGGRQAKLNKVQKDRARQNVPDEFSDIKHERGILSMGKFSEPNTGTSSFSMVLGPAKWLDRKYTVFGRVVRGFDVLTKLEQVETKREGIFVMPKERITILSTYITTSGAPSDLVSQPLPSPSVAAEMNMDSKLQESTLRESKLEEEAKNTAVALVECTNQQSALRTLCVLAVLMAIAWAVFFSSQTVFRRKHDKGEENL
ncbi:hypothetical protein CYMTET_21144 [Cymbomonas tetramitiformis]|uniref:Peptidylprolyl isomerase n=1 Tax=Cymbomonas tetramitiformis TaxID=36881 RepID=A0AAE0G2M9_9CHLO|nr:hypothetical protein CYMTET_21144 [Cymbomonas tetramitiformis]